jgi:hypothetical protein
VVGIPIVLAMDRWQQEREEKEKKAKIESKDERERDLPRILHESLL